MKLQELFVQNAVELQRCFVYFSLLGVASATPLNALNKMQFMRFCKVYRLSLLLSLIL